MIARILALALLLPAAVAAQEMTAEEQAASSAAWKAQDVGRYLEADAILRAVAFGPDGKPKPGFLYDQWAELQGVMTNVPAPRVLPPDVVVDRIEADDTDARRLSTATAHDAVATIVERARTTRVVILNEDHASPRDRAFALQVARALKPLGFTLLGAETFSNDTDLARAEAGMATLAREGYPRRRTGVYTRDPVFGDFVRQALALGYRPFVYESTDHSPQGDWKARIARREQDQADNIARVLKADPDAKMLVYVGFSHATERPSPREGDAPNRWMATRLKAMTGIDPLTIDQTILNDSGSGNPELYALVAPRIGDRPAVLFDGATPLVAGNYHGLVDLQVAHPPLRRENGRPTWLAAMGRTPTPIPAAYLPKAGTRLIQAFVAREAEDAVPVDQVLVTAGEPAPVMMLPGVPVRYAVQDAVAE